MGNESLAVYVKGEDVPKDHARSSILEFGFLCGDAVFDTTSAWNARISKRRAHPERLDLSLRAVRIPSPRPGALPAVRAF